MAFRLSVTVAALLLLFLLLQSLYSSGSEVSTSASPSVSDSASQEEEAENSDLRPSSRLVHESSGTAPTGPVSAESLLEAHFGDRWPEVRERYLEAGWSLETVVDPASLPPFELAAEAWTAHLLMSEEEQSEALDSLLTNDAVSTGDPVSLLPEDEWLQVDEVTKEMARSVARQYEERLMHAGAGLVDAEANARAAILEGQGYQYGPWLLVEGSHASNGLHSAGRRSRNFAFSYGDWVFSARLNAESNPHYGAAAEHYWQLLRERALAMRDVLRN